MLSSITPLGERGRKQRYWLTASSFVVASALGGATLGGLCGLIGGLLAPRGAALAVALVGAAAALLLDGARIGVPTIKRQVDEEWLHRWRGWVYGGGFGLQLGFGLATVVPAGIGYLVWVLAFASASAGAGGLIGAVFGLGRGAALLLGHRVHTPGDLVSFHRRLARWAVGAHRSAIGANAAALGLVVIQLLR